MLPSVDIFSYILLNHHFLSALGANEALWWCVLNYFRPTPSLAPCLRKNSLLACPSPPLPPSIHPHLCGRGQQETSRTIWLYVHIKWCQQVVFYHLGRRTMEREIKGAGKDDTGKL